MSGQGKKGGEQKGGEQKEGEQKEGEKGKKEGKGKKPFSPALAEALNAVGQVFKGEKPTYQGREDPQGDAKKHVLSKKEMHDLAGGINSLKRKLPPVEAGAEQTTQGAGAQKKSDAIRRTPGAKWMS